MLALKSLKEKFSALPIVKKLLVSALALVLLGFSAWAGYKFGFKKIVGSDEALSPKGKLISGKPEEPANFPNPINGVIFKKSEADVIFNRVPLGVMIENSIVARPQRGLSRADIVYEALEEGDITRFLAIYLSQSSQIGPIRSAREYYFDWLVEYQGAYSHWGGNEYVRSLAGKTFGAKDFDQFAIGSPTYYRIAPGGGEHTGHSTTDKLWEVATSRGVNKSSSFENWKFKDDGPATSPTHSIINIGLKGNYAVRWDYDPANNSYKRFNGGAPHMDQEHNVQLTAKAVIVIFIENLGYKEVTPGVSNRNFKTVGGGVAKVFQDGTVIEGTWSKASQEGRTQLQDTSGKEIDFNRGQIWMEMLPVATSVT